MNSKNDLENEKNQEEEIDNKIDIKSKYDSLNTWLDKEDSKYSINQENQEQNKNIINNDNDNDLSLIHI